MFPASDLRSDTTEEHPIYRSARLHICWVLDSKTTGSKGVAAGCVLVLEGYQAVPMIH